jgi:uncharacterized protein with PIN domain
VKFAADGMLGKLTRWLRILGYDVKYSNRMDDHELIALSTKEKRILLTRDLQLYRQATAKGIESLYLEEKTTEQNLAQLAKRYSLDLQVDMRKSRCPICNVRVKPISKKQASSHVELNTLANYDEFWKCPKCGKTYWQGAHWKGIGKTLKKAEEFEASLQ